MRIGIIGHTRGLGKSLYETLSKTHDVIGFSKSNGYNLKDYINFLDELLKLDCVINNAFYKNYQTELFIKLFENWINENKIIVNIGSSVVFDKSNFDELYKKEKDELRNTSLNLIKQNQFKKVKVCNIYPFAMTHYDKFEHLNKVNTEYISNTIEWIINQPYEIREIAIYPITEHKTYTKNTLI